MSTANERRLAAVAMLEKIGEDLDNATQLIRHDLDLGSVELFNDPPFETTTENPEMALCIAFVNATERQQQASALLRQHVENIYGAELAAFMFEDENELCKTLARARGI